MKYIDILMTMFSSTIFLTHMAAGKINFIVRQLDKEEIALTFT